jgi:phage-related protein
MFPKYTGISAQNMPNAEVVTASWQCNFNGASNGAITVGHNDLLSHTQRQLNITK